MTAITGQQFVMEGGARGTAGTDAVASSQLDGATAGLGGVAIVAITPSIDPSLP